MSAGGCNVSQSLSSKFCNAIGFKKTMASLGKWSWKVLGYGYLGGRSHRLVSGCGASVGRTRSRQDTVCTFFIVDVKNMHWHVVIVYNKD
jgi:hypothetical protein